MPDVTKGKKKTEGRAQNEMLPDSQLMKFQPVKGEDKLFTYQLSDPQRPFTDFFEVLGSHSFRPVDSPDIVVPIGSLSFWTQRNVYTSSCPNMFRSARDDRTG